MNPERTRHSTPSAEGLEARRLLAATITNGVLVGTGTSGPDVIAVRRVLTDDVVVTINGVARQFDMDNFTGLRLEGVGGNDTFNLIDPLVSPLVRNTTVLGGAGMDTISYASRTVALKFDIQTVYSTMTIGAQRDRFDEVETVLGGSGADSFDLSTFLGIPPEEEDLRFEFRLEGRGGNDSFDMDGGLSNNFGGITVRGGDGDDFVAANDSPPVPRVFGDGGNDYIQLINELDAKGFIDGGAGIDTVDWFDAPDEVVRDLRDYVSVENAVLGYADGATVFGTDGPNRIVTARDAQRTVIDGLGGNDTLVADGGNNTLLGEAGDDSLSAGGGDDTLDGGPGNDTLDGGPGDDTLLNGEVAPPAGKIRIIDRILTADGSWGGDDVSIERTGGDDVIVRINDLARQFDMDEFDGVLLRGNNGYDVLQVFDPIVAGSRVRKVTLEGGNGNDTLLGSNESSDDVMRGSAGDDHLHGGAGRDALFGGGGNDALVGELGPDFLDGGDNDDVIYASDGAAGDTVLGGSGNDTALLDVGDNTSGIERLG
jgi:Ca2+-binding RTX toxin-like protein